GRGQQLRPGGDGNSRRRLEPDGVRVISNPLVPGAASVAWSGAGFRRVAARAGADRRARDPRDVLVELARVPLGVAAVELDAGGAGSGARLVRGLAPGVRIGHSADL